VSVAKEFSPRYECHRDGLVSIDVSGLERLLGPARVIGDELRRDAAARGMRVHVAVAGTCMAAMVLAQARPGVTIVDRGEEAAALATIPVGILETLDDERTARPGTLVVMSSSPHAIAAFKRWGIRTLGELAALPPADLVARFGRQAMVWQAIARGEDVRPLIPTLDAERFDASLDLEWPIEGLEPLSFVLTRLLEPLSTRLERRDRGAAVLHVVLRLVTCAFAHAGDSREVHARRLELPSPLRDVRTLRTLALLDLESNPPPAAIDRVTIVIDPTPGRVVQHTLYTRPHPTPEQLSTLVARLGALMGQDRLGAPALVDSYRPGVFVMAPFATEHRDRAHRGARLSTGSGRADPVGASDNESVSDPLMMSVTTVSNHVRSGACVSALRRCRQPVPARVTVGDGQPVRVTTDRRGFVGGAVMHAVGPWRSSGHWWAESDRAGQAGQAGEGEHGAIQPRVQPIPPVPAILPWDRDEWDVALNDGAVYRIFQDRETDAWFVEGIVD
jgi:protein ImuB